MDIYNKLKGVLSPEDLAAFKDEVESTIKTIVNEAIVKEQKLLEDKAEEYVNLKVESKISEIEDKAEEYVQMKLQEAKEELIQEYDAKLEDIESNVVESLDRFLNDEIAERISDSLLEDIAINKALLPLAEGMKKLLEDHYVEADTEGSSIISKLKQEKESLEEKLSDEIAEKLELSELAEKAAVELLIKDKTEDLTINESKKVKHFFEGKSFEEVSEKIDGYITIITEEDSSYKNFGALNEDYDDGIDDNNHNHNIDDDERDLLRIAGSFM